MAPKRRWLRWILLETATAEPILPWHRGARRRRAHPQDLAPRLLEQA